MNYKNHLILEKATIYEAMERLNNLRIKLTLFVVDEDGRLKGTVTDGDIRRSLLSEKDMEQTVTTAMNKNFKSLTRGNFDIYAVKDYKNKGVQLLPLLDEQGRIVKIFDLEHNHTVLPVDALIMAGGEGKRLRPMTDTAPKPMLTIGEKPILEHNIDRLCQFGVEHIYISVCYLSDQIKSYFGDGNHKNVRITYLDEEQPLGTIGCIRMLENLHHDSLLVMNADLLTTINFEDFFVDFISKEVDMSVASIPYEVKIPYGVLETEQEKVTTFKEKPVYTYYSNAGIYLLKDHIRGLIKENGFHETTQLIEHLLNNNCQLTYYPLTEYWLDIGKMEDYRKAQRDIIHLPL